MLEPNNRLEQMLIDNVRRDANILNALLERVNHWNVYTRLIYKFYSGSFKVYHLQEVTEQIVAALAAIAPEGRAFHRRFTEIIRSGTGRKFTDNEHWMERTTPIVQAFLHAKYFLEMAVTCAASSDPLRALDSGWQSLTELYRIYEPDWFSRGPVE